MNLRKWRTITARQTFVRVHDSPYYYLSRFEKIIYVFPMEFLKKIFGRKKPSNIAITQGVSQATDKVPASDELPDSVDEAIKSYCAKGDELAKDGQYEEAVREYNKAWAIIPDPKEHWNASIWVLAAIADSSFLKGDNKTTRKALEFALLNCPDALGNPFLHLRYGQVLFDVEELEHAADELMRAYMGGGKEIFETEDEKYLSFLRTKADGI